MTGDSTSDVLERYLRENSLRPVESSELASGRNLVDAEIIDSLGIMVLLSFLEERFQVTFELDEMVLANFDTFPKLVAIVDRKRSGP